MIEWLEEWYLSNCDSYWEHCYGVKIETLDNPGWTISIDLQETNLEDTNFVIVDIERSDDDWVYCKIEESIFKGAGGPKNLKEMISIFRDWAIEAQRDSVTDN